MQDILPYFLCLQPSLNKTTCRHLAVIATAMLAMTGRITQLGISRWTTGGGSYRTVQRFFQTALDWQETLTLFFLHHLWDPTDTYLLVGDETVVGKAGKTTYGLDWFYSSLAQRAIPGLAFFGLALVSRQKRRAYPLCAAQVVRSEEEKEQARNNKARRTQSKSQALPSRKRGRPKGSKNQNKAQRPLSAELQRIEGWVRRVLVRLPPFLVVRHLVLDAHFGHPAAAQMARAVGLHLVSKLRSDAALYREPTPQEKQAHPRKKYGDKVDYCALPQECRVSCEQAEGVRTEVYQIRCWHKDFPERLNILIVLKTDLSAQKRGHIVLFSTDLTLSAEALWDGYALRFQIEFVFRDAKQHFGLDDFQAVNETAVANAVGLSLLLVNLTEVLLEPLRQEREEASILDLKAYFRGRRYAQETLKWLPVLPEGIVWEQLLAQVARLGSIHPFAWVARRGLRKQPNAQCRGEREAPQAP